MGYCGHRTGLGVLAAAVMAGLACLAVSGPAGGVAVPPAGLCGRAVEVPGLSALATGPGAEVNSVSCASAGNCAAGGDYTDRGGHDQGFVVGERNGRWGAAIEVPGLAALNVGGFAQVMSVSCGSAGN